MSVKVYVPGDAAALSVGADAVAKAIARADRVAPARRYGGPQWVARDVLAGAAGRSGDVSAAASLTGPLPRETVPGLFDAGFLEGKPHALHLGAHRRDSLSQAAGAADVRALRHHRSAFAFRLRQPRRLSRTRARAEAHADADRRRGHELRACAAAAARAFPPASSGEPFCTPPADQKYIVCNADEGDSGTYADRMIMEGDPFVLIEGMTIAGFAVGATRGYIYIRSEYPHAFRTAAARHRHRVRKRLSRRECRRQRQAIRSRAAHGRRRVHLRRGNLAARKPRRQARPDPLQAAAARASRACSASRPSSTT